MSGNGDNRDTVLARILEGRQANYEAQDTAILTISSGGLGASLAFIKDIVPLKEAILTWVLVGSWLMFLFSIFSILASYILSQQAHDLRYELERCSDDALKPALGSKCASACARVEACNRLAAACLVTALLLTVAFAGPNVLRIGK